MNNLFWEVTSNWQSGKKINWAGNVFLNHKIVLSAIHMASGYLLLSTGKSEAVERLVDYGRTKHWYTKGIMGARESVEEFSLRWQNKSEYSLGNLTKRFTIFQSFRIPEENSPPGKLNSVVKFSIFKKGSAIARASLHHQRVMTGCLP